MKGLSVPQLFILIACAAALLATIAASIADLWKLAAVVAAVTFGFFVILVVFTLAAMTRTAKNTRMTLRRSEDEMRQLRHIAAGVRRIDDRTAERFKVLDATQDRIEATERRVLAALETHRFQLEDQLAEFQGRTSGSDEDGR